MRYEWTPLWYLPLYVILIALAGGLVTAGATYWNWEMGLYAGGFGAVMGLGGYLLSGVRIPSTDRLLYVSLENTCLELRKVEDQRDAAKEQLAEAIDILGHALGYLDHSPLEGVMDVSDEIREFFIEVENRASGN